MLKKSIHYRILPGVVILQMLGIKEQLSISESFELLPVLHWSKRTFRDNLRVDGGGWSRSWWWRCDRGGGGGGNQVLNCSLKDLNNLLNWEIEESINLRFSSWMVSSNILTMLKPLFSCQIVEL